MKLFIDQRKTDSLSLPRLLFVKSLAYSNGMLTASQARMQRSEKILRIKYFTSV